MTFPDAVSLLDRDRADFLAAYDALSPEQRSFRPPDGGWTADEIAQHLVKAETGTLTIVQKQAAAGDARRDVGTPDEARLAGVEAFLRSDGRTTMPESAAAFIAPTSPPDAGWRDRFAAFGIDWHTLAESVPPEMEVVGLMTHPRAGAITASGCARFIGAHIDHHARQLARLCEADGFPA